MSNIKELEKYLNYEFSSGCETGEDYKQFERKYINYLKSMCKENGWKLVNVGKNHYEFSAFLLCEYKYIYLSISDVRFFNNEWYNNILIRTAQSETDYSGGSNHYSTLPTLKFVIQNLINKG
jgi:hypothetical protein